MAKLKFTEYTLHPAGIHKAQIVNVVEEKFENSRFGDGEALKINFLTPAGPISALCSLKYSEQSKLGKLVSAALGGLPADLDTDSLEGKRVVLVVEHIKDDSGTVRDKVTNIIADNGNDPFANQ